MPSGNKTDAIYIGPSNYSLLCRGANIQWQGIQASFISHQIKTDNGVVLTCISTITDI